MNREPRPIPPREIRRFVPATRHGSALVRLTVAALATLGVLSYRPPAFAANPPQKAPDPKEASGKVYEWKSKDGVAFAWRGPKKYDTAAGVALTVILHGSNLTHAWGFANHKAETFRPDDLVVCPDGTTPNGQGGFNFLDAPADVKKFHALVDELKVAFKIRGTYLYGHSQGSFFALKYAGEYPDEVDGVVAHASGLWASSRIGATGHRQAIVLMHGTLDPVVPYSQSVGAFDALKQAGYPMLRLRSLEGWNHWPAEHNGPVEHTSQQLAWVEGMTTKDSGRLAACFAKLAEVKKKEEHDWAALYALAKHIDGGNLAAEPLKARARKAITVVESLAKAHAAALATAKPGSAFEKKAWAGHLPIFLRAFAGVPARGEVYAAWQDAFKTQQTTGAELLKSYYSIAEQPGKEAEAFVSGVAAITGAFLTQLNSNGVVVTNLAAWAKDAKKLKIPKKSLDDYAAIQETVKLGWQAFGAVNNKAGAP
jgi:predicted esterase